VVACVPGADARSKNKRRGTSNIQHPTSNIERRFGFIAFGFMAICFRLRA
jgi:hypothetical protein